jgi:hypothetical protein
MTLTEFTDVVRKVEGNVPVGQNISGSKKSNGMSVELGQYLDSLSDPAIMVSEVDRLSNEVTQLLECSR